MSNVHFCIVMPCHNKASPYNTVQCIQVLKAHLFHIFWAKDMSEVLVDVWQMRTIVWIKSTWRFEWGFGTFSKYLSSSSLSMLSLVTMSCPGHVKSVAGWGPRNSWLHGTPTTSRDTLSFSSSITSSPPVSLLSEPSISPRTYCQLIITRLTDLDFSQVTPQPQVKMIHTWLDDEMYILQYLYLPIIFIFEVDIYPSSWN